MDIRTIAYCFLLIAISYVSSAHAQVLWHGTSYGMTPEQVRAAAPSVESPANVDSLHDGSRGLLTIANVELVNEKFNAVFYFKEDKLTEVMLSLVRARPFPQVRLVFDSVKDALRSKYGPEISLSEGKSGLNSLTAIFKNGATNIDILAMSVGGSPALLNVIYQERLSSEASKF
jgi:hypothetical protein